jgi:hypothetical protein
MSDTSTGHVESSDNTHRGDGVDTTRVENMLANFQTSFVPFPVSGDFLRIIFSL